MEIRNIEEFIESFIKDLSPELQEKARACKSLKELETLANDSDIPIPDEAVEAVAGGKADSGEDVFHEPCPHGRNGEGHKWILKGSSFQTEFYECQYCHKQYMRYY